MTLNRTVDGREWKITGRWSVLSNALHVLRRSVDFFSSTISYWSANFLSGNFRFCSGVNSSISYATRRYASRSLTFIFRSLSLSTTHVFPSLSRLASYHQLFRLIHETCWREEKMLMNFQASVGRCRWILMRVFKFSFNLLFIWYYGYSSF